MSLPVLDGVLPTAVWLMVKVSVLLAGAALAHLLLRRRASAASRHLLWTMAVAGALLLPLASFVAPTWDVAVRVAQPNALVPAPPRDHAAMLDHADLTPPAPQTTTARPSTAVPREAEPATAPAMAAVPTALASDSPAAGPSAAGAAAPMSWRMWALVAYASGVLVLFGYLLVQYVAARRLARHATAVQDPEWTSLLAECARAMGVERPVRLLRSRAQTMPMAFGTRRPTILIPAIADTWADDRRRAVLLHELAHVARYDCLTQMLAAIACTLYWVHPGVWWMARRLRIERELACDDRVLTVGTQAPEYAGHLLELAYALGGHRAPALVVSMARPKQLEGRMLAVLDGARSRTMPSARGRLVGLVILTALLVPLGGLQVVPAVSARVSHVHDDAGVQAASDTDAPDSDQAATGQERTDAAAAPRRPHDPVRLEKRLRPWDPMRSLMNTARDVMQRATAGIASLQDQLPGTWEIRPAEESGFVELRMRDARGRSNWGTTVPMSTFQGLTSAQLTSTSNAPVKFTIKRDAGTIVLEGIFRHGVGAGTFDFEPDPSFPAALAKRGFDAPNQVEQYELARNDIGFAYVDELTKQGYPKPTTAQLVRAGQHGARLDYLRGMGELNYRLGDIETLIKMRDHGVSPKYVKDLAAQGLPGLPAEQILKLRDHGVSAEYIGQLKELGYGGLTPEQLLKARDHGVSAEFVRELRDLGHKLPLEEVITARDHGVSARYIRELADLGYGKLPLDAVTKARDHGVSPEYARELRNFGYRLTLDEVIRTRDHGVSVEFVKELSALGYKDLPIEKVIKARDHGVSTEFIRGIKALGYDRVDIDEAIKLRDRGLTPDRIRRANERAGTRLPLDMLRDLAR